jgi:hypothetical protein
VTTQTSDPIPEEPTEMMERIDFGILNAIRTINQQRGECCIATALIDRIFATYHALAAARQEIARLRTDLRNADQVLGMHGLVCDVQGYVDEREALRRERDALAQDAARYRYIRSAVPESRFELTGEKVPITPEQYDRMIDAALSLTGEPNDDKR